MLPVRPFCSQVTMIPPKNVAYSTQFSILSLNFHLAYDKTAKKIHRLALKKGSEPHLGSFEYVATQNNLATSQNSLATP